MDKNDDRWGRIEFYDDKDIEFDDGDVSFLSEPVEIRNEENPPSSNDSASYAPVIYRPRSRLGRLWARLRPLSPLRTLQVMASVAVFIVMAAFIVDLSMLPFSRTGRVICTGLGSLMTLAALIAGFVKRGGSSS